MTSFTDLESGLTLLVDQICWAILAGEGTGSALSLLIGKKIPRAEPIPNKWLSDEAREFNGEFELLIDCAWRLDTHSEVICGSGESNRNDGPMIQGLQKIEGSEIESVSIQTPAGDLSIKFKSEITLKVFCDRTEDEEHVLNYVVFFPEFLYSVGPRGQVVRE